MMIPRFMVAALCVLAPLTCVAHGGNINGEATYISFSVPGAVGTYPTGINASMEVTGYYNASPTMMLRFSARSGRNDHYFQCDGSGFHPAGGHQCGWAMEARSPATIFATEVTDLQWALSADRSGLGTLAGVKVNYGAQKRSAGRGRFLSCALSD